MRNLLGRLNTRLPDDLARIADIWGIPLPTGENNRHRQVGALYRAMTDPRAIRDAWERLTEPQRAVIRHLVLGEEQAVSLAEIASIIDGDEVVARSVATVLYRAGILTRDGDDASMPVGAVPQLFIPRELAQGFRRLQDEIEAGDLRRTPLRALISLLDDTEMEESAAIWGIRVIPGLRRRDDLARQILQQAADPSRVRNVASKRGPVASRIWDRIHQGGDAGEIPLAEAARAAGLEPAKARDAAQFRHGLAELEGALLVWHTYRPDGSRWLFVPAELGTDRAAAEPPVAPPAPIAPERVTPYPWRHPDALAWDLLTIVREVTLPTAPRVDTPESAPRPWLRHLNRVLWNRADDVPPSGYLTFVLALATACGLIAQRPEDEGPFYEVAPRFRAWRDRSFPEQFAQLREVWLGSADWIEGRGRTELAVWGADWRGFRGRLSKLLDELVAPTPNSETWYRFTDVAEWAADRDQDLLGATFTAATARREDASGDASERRRAALTDAVVAECETAFVWTGAIEFASVHGRGRAVRVRRRRAEGGNIVQFPTAGSHATALSGPGATVSAMGGQALTVHDSGDITLERPSPLLVWSLSAFATCETLAEVPRYRLSPESLARALGAGFDVKQVTSFLARQSGEPLPPEVAARLETWTRGYRRVRLHRALVLSVDDRAATDELTTALTLSGGTLAPLPDGRVLFEFTTGDDLDDDALPGLIAALRAAGFSPQTV